IHDKGNTRRAVLDDAYTRNIHAIAGKTLRDAPPERIIANRPDKRRRNAESPHSIGKDRWSAAGIWPAKLVDLVEPLVETRSHHFDQRIAYRDNRFHGVDIFTVSGKPIPR